jgi:hypothetical protein
MRAVSPEAKLMFVTIESSLDVVDEAFSIGADGYVYKPRAHRDLLPVLDTIIRGGRFVSGGLERVDQGDCLASHQHPVLFYSSDKVLVEAFSRFIAGALDVGHVVIVLVTEAHDERIRQSLRASHVDIDRAIREQRYLLVNPSELLEKIMVGGRPDPTRFATVADDLLTEATQRIANPHARVVACGECAPSLWAHGQIEAALQLEHLWDGLVKSRQLDTLCAYPLIAREESLRAVRSLCAEHTTVEIS